MAEGTVISERFDDLGANGEPVRLGIIGGTFDPIHVGHLRMAEEVREALGLHAVLFIPTNTPVYKKDQGIADPRTRFYHVRKAVQSNPHFDASSLEIDRGGDTYTIDTLRTLREHYPENVELFFIMGADAAESLAKWRNSQELAKLGIFAVATGRPGSIDEDRLRQKINNEDVQFDLRFVPVSPLGISSHDIRDRLAAGRSIRYLVPPNVNTAELAANERKGRHAARAGLQSHEGAGLQPREGADLQQHTAAELHSDSGASANNDTRHENDPQEVLGDEFYEARRAELQQRVSAKRYEHSLAVSQTAEQLAQLYGVDTRKARLAGLLHDWDKNMDDVQIRERVYELGMQDEIDPYVVSNLPATLHGITAARALGRAYPQLPDDILQAISRHTVADTAMDPLDMVLYIADCIEPSRHYGNVQQVREAVGEATLEELFFLTYEYWTLLLLQKRRPLHPDTIRVWNEYATRRAPRKDYRRNDG